MLRTPSDKVREASGSFGGLRGTDCVYCAHGLGHAVGVFQGTEYGIDSRTPEVAQIISSCLAFVPRLPTSTTS